MLLGDVFFLLVDHLPIRYVSVVAAMLRYKLSTSELACLAHKIGLKRWKGFDIRRYLADPKRCIECGQLTGCKTTFNFRVCFVCQYDPCSRFCMWNRHDILQRYGHIKGIRAHLLRIPICKRGKLGKYFYFQRIVRSYFESLE